MATATGKTTTTATATGGNGASSNGGAAPPKRAMLRRPKQTPGDDMRHTLAVGVPIAVILFLVLPRVLN